MRVAFSAAALLMTVMAAACEPPRRADADAASLDATDAADDHGASEADVPDASVCPVRRRDENTPGTELILGAGRDGMLDGFRPLIAGEAVYIAPGEQGLQHIVLALRGRGFDPTLPLITARIVYGDACTPVGYLRFRLPFRADPAEPTRLAVEAVRIVLQDDVDPLEFCDVLDRDVTLVVDLDDLAGKSAHREISLHVAGVDPTTRADVLEAYRMACERRAAGDGGVDAARDDGPLDAGDRDARLDAALQSDGAPSPDSSRGD